MFHLKSDLIDRLIIKNTYSVFLSHFIVFLLAAATIDIPPYLIAKNSYFTSLTGRLEDNLLVDGTSHVWAVLFTIIMGFGLLSANFRGRLYRGIQDFYPLLLSSLPFFFFVFFRVVLDPDSLSGILQVLLPVLFLCSYWVWFIAFRPFFEVTILYNYLIICIFIVTVVQIFTALSVLPGSESVCNAELQTTGQITASKEQTVTPTREYLKFFTDDGYISILSITPPKQKEQYATVDLCKHGWLYVIDQWIHGKIVGFFGMADSAFLLCLITWLGCGSFLKRLTWPFFVLYPLCFFSALVSGSRLGIWGSGLVIICYICHAFWSWRPKVAAATGISVLLIFLSIIWLYEPTTKSYLLASDAADPFNLNGIEVSALPSLVALFDYSFYFRLEEFKFLAFERSFLELLLGSSTPLEWSHSFVLNSTATIGLIGLTLLLMPVMLILHNSETHTRSPHVLTAVLVGFISLIFHSTPASWLIVFPIFVALLQARR